MRFVEEIYEAMLTAATFAPAYWLVVLVAGLLAIAAGERFGTKLGIGLFAALAAMTWLGSKGLESQCVQCNLVDRIYMTEVRWGLLFWEFVLFLVLLALRANTAHRNRRTEKEI